MTLKTRISPCLDIANRRVTKGVKFANNVDLGDPVWSHDFDVQWDSADHDTGHASAADRNRPRTAAAAASEYASAVLAC